MVSSFSIADRANGQDQRSYVIAEMSGSHNGNLSPAPAIIEMAEAADTDTKIGRAHV